MKFKDRKAPPLPKGQFSVIYADPPYQYEFAHTHIRAASEVYPTMNIDEICEMGKDVQRLSAPNCTLLLWTPASHLDKFPAILEAWGFRYNTCWVWNKISAKRTAPTHIGISATSSPNFRSRRAERIICA